MTSAGCVPSGWVLSALGEVATYQNGRAFKPTEWKATGLPIIRIQNLNDETAAFNFSDEPHEKRFAVEKGDLLFAWSASLGAYIWRGERAWLNQHIFRVDHSKQIDRLFLYYALKNVVAELYAKAHGSGMVHVTKRRFEETPLWLPPLTEQRRIVDRIETIFDEIDRGVESLQAAKRTVGLYRQSLLKSAFEGRLTAAWRAKNADTLESQDALMTRTARERPEWYKMAFRTWTEDVETWQSESAKGPKPRRPERNLRGTPLTPEERALLPEIPDEWVFLRLHEVAAVGSGMSVSKARKLEVPVNVPYLRVANVQRGFLDLREIKTMQIERSQRSSLGLRQWDILFNEGGDRDKLGRGWIWECQVPHCITQNHVFRASPFRHDLGWSKYISLWGNSFGRDYFEKRGKQTTNLASINKTVLKDLPVPCCSPDECTEIVRILDDRLDAAKVLDAEIEASLARAEALRHSVLRSAFAGQLLTQELTDEPASVLLERVRGERNKTHATRRGEPTEG